MNGVEEANELPLANTTTPSHASEDLDLKQDQGLQEETDTVREMEAAGEAGADGGASPDSEHCGPELCFRVAENSCAAAARGLEDAQSPSKGGDARSAPVAADDSSKNGCQLEGPHSPAKPKALEACGAVGLGSQQMPGPGPKKTKEMTTTKCAISVATGKEGEAGAAMQEKKGVQKEKKGSWRRERGVSSQSSEDQLHGLAGGHRSRAVKCKCAG